VVLQEEIESLFLVVGEDYEILDTSMSFVVSEHGG